MTSSSNCFRRSSWRTCGTGRDASRRMPSRPRYSANRRHRRVRTCASVTGWCVWSRCRSRLRRVDRKVRPTPAISPAPRTLPGTLTSHLHSSLLPPLTAVLLICCPTQQTWRPQCKNQVCWKFAVLKISVWSWGQFWQKCNFYTVSQKTRHAIVTIISLNRNRFSKFFYRWKVC